MLFFRSGMFVVGPESAGANPGPACYGKGWWLLCTYMKNVLSTHDVTHVMKWTRLSPQIFKGLASSKVTHWNYCKHLRVENLGMRRAAGLDQAYLCTR